MRALISHQVQRPSASDFKTDSRSAPFYNQIIENVPHSALKTRHNENQVRRRWTDGHGRTRPFTRDALIEQRCDVPACSKRLHYLCTHSSCWTVIMGTTGNPGGRARNYSIIWRARVGIPLPTFDSSRPKDQVPGQGIAASAEVSYLSCQS